MNRKTFVCCWNNTVHELSLEKTLVLVFRMHSEGIERNVYLIYSKRFFVFYFQFQIQLIVFLNHYLAHILSFKSISNPFKNLLFP